MNNIASSWERMRNEQKELFWLTQTYKVPMVHWIQQCPGLLAASQSTSHSTIDYPKPKIMYESLMCHWELDHQGTDIATSERKKIKRHIRMTGTDT